MERTKYIPSEKRETMNIFINGHILTLVKVEEHSNRITPYYMGMKGWALKSVIKLKRNNLPKKKNHE